MAIADNCTDTIPTSNIYFEGLSVGYEVGIGICTAACVTVIVLFIEQAFYINKKYQTDGDPEIKFKSLWLLGIYPLFSLTALLAVYVPRASLLADLVSSVYLAMCMFHFTSLIILYFGGIQELLMKTQETGFAMRNRPFCCCCFCCPHLKATRQNLKILRFMVLQASFLQPFLSFFTIVLWLNGQYVKGKLDPDQPSLYLSIINSVSTITAMYGLIVLYRSTQDHLTTHSIKLKFVVLQLAIVFHNLQGFIFSTLVKNDVIRCTATMPADARADALQHMILIGEMTLLSSMARALYRRPFSFGQSLEGNDFEQSSREQPDSVVGERYGSMANVVSNHADVFEAGNDTAAIVSD